MMPFPQTKQAGQQMQLAGSFPFAHGAKIAPRGTLDFTTAPPGQDGRHGDSGAVAAHGVARLAPGAEIDPEEGGHLVGGGHEILPVGGPDILEMGMDLRHGVQNQ